MYVSIGKLCLFCCIADSWRKLLINLNNGGFIWFPCTGAADAFLKENVTCFFNTSWSHRSVPIYACLTNWSCFEIAQKRSLNDSVASSSGCGVASETSCRTRLNDLEMLCSLPALMSDCSFCLFCLRLNVTWHQCSALLSRLCINQRFRQRVR